MESISELPAEGVEPQDEPVRERRKHRSPLPAILAVMALLLVGFLAIPASQETQYSFFKADHPIDVDAAGSGRWFYYMPDVGGMTPAQLAGAARAELLARGYVEDTSNKPWYHFRNGDREVIVCNHDEIADGDSSPVTVRIMHERPMPAGRRQNWPVVWVKEPGARLMSVIRFKLQKLVHGW